MKKYLRTEVPQLRLGTRYTATLVDLEQEDTFASFQFTASKVNWMCFCESWDLLLSLYLMMNDNRKNPETVMHSAL